MSYHNYNPWEICEINSYPDGVSFAENDSRFWVSKDRSGHLILFVQEAESLQVEDIVRDIFSGLVLYHDIRSAGTRFVIKLEAKDLNAKFVTVCRSIVDGSKDYSGVELFAFIYKELIAWSSFMRPKRDGLSHEEYTGLWGELSVVVDHYFVRFGAQGFIENWTGIKRTPQDLAVRDFTLEVKATFTVTPKAIHISSLEQLDAPVMQQALAHLRLSKSPDGRSLDDLVLSIGSSLKDLPTEAARFQRAIAELLGDASEEQMQQKNIILGTDCFAIRDDFPRLRRSKIDVSIAKGEYKILIHGLSEYKIDDGIEGFFKDV
jgi:hypothetical protein